MVSYYEANERARVPQLVERMLAGSTVALITDAGMPAISDPGYRLVRAAAEAGVPVRAVPGAVGGDDGAGGVGAAVRPLGVRGLPAAGRRASAGPGSRRWRPSGARSCFLESPRRVGRTLAELAEAFGADRAGGALPRAHQDVRGSASACPLGELAAWAAEREVRGEITLVVAGAPDPEPPAAADLAAMVAAREAAGLDRKAAMTEVARAAGVPRREVYDAVLAARPEAVDNVLRLCPWWLSTIPQHATETSASPPSPPTSCATPAGWSA